MTGQTARTRQAEKRTRPPRPTPRPLQYVRPNLLPHEAQAVLDWLRAGLSPTLDAADAPSPFLATAADELVRVLAEYAQGRR